jgi:K+-sensing histidine kinase KdpD
VLTLDRTEERRGENAQTMLAAVSQMLGASLDADLSLASAVRLALTGFADDCAAYVEDDGGAVRRFRAGGAACQTDIAGVEIRELPTAVAQVLADMQTRSFSETGDRSTCVAAPIPCTERRGGALLFRWVPPFDIGAHEVELARELGQRLAAAIDRIELARRSSEAVRARDWLLHKVTHDLGNPVASIVMVADRLLRTAPDADRRTRSRGLLEGVKQQSEEMRLIIEELLDATALRTGLARVSAHPVSPASVLRRAASLLQPIAEQRGIEVVVEAAEGMGRVTADANRLRHGLTALLTDQIGWCEVGDCVRIAASADRGEVVFEITGPGPDLSADEIERRLERTAPGPGVDEGGPSLPLLIGTEIIRAHGGRVRVVGAPDGAITYRFTLPSAL